tara:strand:- start:1385 stop:2869 length:1485 start_codon:yes stop_codon:yes gene_type:complete
MKKITIIGSGISGLSAACYLSKADFNVTVIEKNSTAGGRLSQFKKNGFIFDKGPSWYWMPDIFDNFFKDFNKKASDFYNLVRLDPSYQFITKNNIYNIPANFDDLCELFEKIEPNSSLSLKKYISLAEQKYRLSVDKFLNLNGESFSELADPSILKNIHKLNIFISLRKHIRKYFKNQDLKTLLEFPSMFLGGTPSNTPGVYSMMNFADIKGGTWYPMGGMYEITRAMKKLAIELGVNFKFNQIASEFSIKKQKINEVMCNSYESYKSDHYVSNCEYPFTQLNLIDKKNRSYSKKYWSSRKIAPSAIIFYLGVSKKINFLKHHNLFFDESFDNHLSSIYKDKKNPKKPLFYVCCPSKTDSSIIPDKSMENLFILIPVSTSKNPSKEAVDYYYEYVLQKLEKYEGSNIQSHIIEKASYTKKDFVSDYNAYDGNAYGLANTLFQTATFKPKISDKKIKNLSYCGHFTVPGPGIPPSIISGKIVSKTLEKKYEKTLR